MNFTPGPWHAATQEKYTLGGDMLEIVLLDKEGMVTDQIAAVLIDTGEDEPEDRKRWKEQEANAQLIAAAPELYEIVKVCADRYLMQNTSIMEKAKAAIAKAEGKAR